MIIQWLAIGDEISVALNGCGCTARIGIRKAVMDKDKRPIKSFHDLDVFQSTYKSMLVVLKHILPKLPKEEEYEAIPRLIAEGHSKRHQKKGFQKYLYDAMAE